MRERANGRGNHGGRGRGRGRGRDNERNISATTEHERVVRFEDEPHTDATTRDDRGGRNGRSFGRGAYGAGAGRS